MIYCKMVEVNDKHVVSEYEILRLGPGPEPPPEHDVRSLDFGPMKLTLLMIDSWRTLACIYWAQNAHSRGPQHSMIPYHVDNPYPDPEPPPRFLNGSQDPGAHRVGPGGEYPIHGLDSSCESCGFSNSVSRVFEQLTGCRRPEGWARRTEAYNKHLRRHRYEIGDLFLYLNYALKGKPGHPWEHRWKGPVTVVRLASKGNLDLEHPEGDVMKGWHTDKVRPYVLRV
jgi:hypothetical protein